MHNGQWHDGWSSGSWWWMALMMIAFWGGIVWLAVTLIRREHHQPQPHSLAADPLPRATPEEILAERLARGEIEPDDYRHRLDVLRSKQTE